MWTDRRIIDLFGIDVPIIQAPMTGPTTIDLVVAVSEAGGLGSLPFATVPADNIRAQLHAVRQRTNKPINANFFCHNAPRNDAATREAWRNALAPYYQELGVAVNNTDPAPLGGPFGETHCAVVEELRPEIVSFHIGLPEPELMDRVKATGAKVIASATTVAEARWLEAHGCDAVIAQGIEAGGHRGMFLCDDLATQVGTIALVPQVVDAVGIPVIAAGGITDARGIAAALILGASAVQLGTAYLFCPEATVSAPYRCALETRSEQTTLTNVFTGRVGRSVTNRLIQQTGPISDQTPDFPLAMFPLAPLIPIAEAAGLDDLTPLWAGQAAPLGQQKSAGELTRQLAQQTRILLGHSSD